MAYIGKEPIVGNFQVCDAITVVNGQAAYTLQVSSTNVTPESSHHMLVSLNGILQKNGGTSPSFTISGSTLTFASNLITGDVIDFVMLLGNVLDLGVPSDATVTNAKLGTDVISGETDIGGAIADADLFLVDDGASGTLRKTAASRIKTYVGSGLSEADMWRITSGFSGASTPISSNWERADTQDFAVLGTGLSQSSGVFTFPSTGYYFITFQAAYSINGNKRNIGTLIQHTTDNGSNWTELAYSSDFITQTESDATMTTGVVTGIAHILDTSNDKVRFSAGASSVNTSADTNAQHTGIVCIKLADT
jgi:hypothetical protein